MTTIKACACGKTHTRAEWKALHFCGYYNDNAPADPEHPEAGEPKGWCEMRNCSCGSTLMVQCALVDREHAFFGVPFIDANKTFIEALRDYPPEDVELMKRFDDARKRREAT